ncbi:hypothetical protein QFZ82_001521 [Streptomyces sp. V4I23]|nr:hypothetical protein [Streptomyces sp. V4I23]
MTAATESPYAWRRGGTPIPAHARSVIRFRAPGHH